MSALEVGRDRRARREGASHAKILKTPYSAGILKLVERRNMEVGIDYVLHFQFLKYRF